MPVFEVKYKSAEEPLEEREMIMNSNKSKK